MAAASHANKQRRGATVRQLLDAQALQRRAVGPGVVAATFNRFEQRLYFTSRIYQRDHVAVAVAVPDEFDEESCAIGTCRFNCLTPHSALRIPNLVAIHGTPQRAFPTALTPHLPRCRPTLLSSAT